MTSKSPTAKVHGAVDVLPASVARTLREIAHCRTALERDVAAALAGELDEEGCIRGKAAADKLAALLGKSEYHSHVSLLQAVAKIFAGGPDVCRAPSSHLLDLTVEIKTKLAPIAATSPERVSIRILAVGREDYRCDVVGGAGNLDAYVEVTQSLTEARQVLASEPPDVMLVDLQLGGDTRAVLELVRELAERKPPIPTIVAGRDDAWQDRWEAAQAGAIGYVRKAFAPSLLIGIVLATYQQWSAEPSRVVSLNANPSVVGGLEAAGYQVLSETATEGLWNKLSDTQPEALIVDIGARPEEAFTLCRTLRAEPRWRALNIVLLGEAATLATLQGHALAAGASQLVSRDIPTADLAAIVRQLQRQARMQQHAGYRDPRSGAEGQRSSARRFEQFLGFAARQHQSVCLAAIGLDQEAELRREHGPSAVDDALTAVAEYLEREFRSLDVIARWSGATLLAGLYGISATQTSQRLADIFKRLPRSLFAQPMWPNTRISLSAGVAAFPQDGDSLPALHRAAANALQRARKAGTDRIVHGKHLDPVMLLPRADVLVVDDDENEPLHTLLKGFQSKGWDVHWLRSGGKAVEALTGATRSLVPKVVILSTALNDMSGLTVLTQIRREVIIKYVLLASSAPSAEEVLVASRLGATDYLLKPYDLDQAMNKVQPLIEMDY